MDQKHKFQTRISDILEQPMDRAQFLKFIALVALSIVGLGQLAKLIGKTSNMSSSSQSVANGKIRYGGDRRRS